MTISTSPSPRRVAWCVALVAVVVHVGIGVGGAWSFEPLNYDDPQVLSLAADTSVQEILTEPVWYAYKPVYFLSLKIDTWFGAGMSAVAHVVNVLLHALAAALLFLVLRALTRNLWLAAGAALLFAVHPVHAESVAWISSRKDVLSLVFVLLGHLAYRRARGLGGVSWLAPVLLLLGGLTKGTVWVWAGVLLLDELVEAAWRLRGEAASGGPTARWGMGSSLVRLAPCFVVAIGGVVLDATMAIGQGPGSVEHGVSTMSLAAAMSGVHVRYLFNVVVPVRLSIDYAVDPAGSWSQPLAWVGLVLLLAAIGLFFLSIRRRWPLGMLGSGLWLLGLLPVNNLWPRTAILMADRYLYLPAAGLYLVLLALLSRWRAGRMTVLAVGLVVLGGLGVQRTGVFKDSETVWADATAKEPGSALAWFQRGQAAAADGQWENAVTWAQKAIDLHPRPEIRVRAHLLETGALLGRLGDREQRGTRARPEDLEQAIDAANRAAKLADELETTEFVREDPREVQAEAQVLRGKVLERWRDPASALDAYRRAVTLSPTHATARYDYATLLASTGTATDLELAEGHLEEAVRLRRDFLDAEIQLATVKALRGRFDDAVAVLARAQERHGRTPELLFAEAQVHIAGRQDVQKAEELLQELKRTAPEHPKASRLLADIRLAEASILLGQGRDENDKTKLRAALERFEAAGRARERTWKAEVGAGDVLVRLGRYRAARERYLRALDWSDDLPWIRKLASRAGVLEAAWTARYAEDDLDRADAARLMAGAIRPPITAVDLGFLSYREELTWFRRAAARLADQPELAGRVLRAAALAATGDEEGALGELRYVVETLSPDTDEFAVLEAAVLLRGLVLERARDVSGAQRQYRRLRDRRKGDPLPLLRLLQTELDVARHGLSIAQSFPEDEDGLAAAAAMAERAAEAVSVFADAHPDVLAAGLLATEGEMHQGRWTVALRRLNALKARFPREPDVYRGLSAIYMTWYLATRNHTLVQEGERALRQALQLDPRDAQTLLDASQLARVAGSFERAVDYARRARTFELVPDGPAGRALADLHLALGRQALKHNDWKAALAAAETARKADPGGAGPWVLKGDVLLQVQKFDEAVDAYRTAKELQPWSDAAKEGLARAHRQQARLYFLKAARYRPPKHPREVDPDAWAEKSDEQRKAAVEAWEKATRETKRLRELWRRQEIRATEAALRLAPEAEESESLRRRLEELRGTDPEAERAAYHEAEVAFGKGRDLYDEGKLAEALVELQHATNLYASHLRAHVYTAAAAYAQLRAPTGDSPEQRQFETSRWLLAMEALHASDSLDPHERYPDRHRVRGLLHEWRWIREELEEDRITAVRAYERYVRAMEALGRGDDRAVARVRKLLAGLQKGG